MMAEDAVIINGERLSRREAFIQLKAGLGIEPPQLSAVSEDLEPEVPVAEEEQAVTEPESEAGGDAQEESAALEGPDVLIEYELTPDPFTGLYSICAKKPDPDYSAQQAKEVFSKYGDIGKINITKKWIFVCYVAKEDAEAAMEGLQQEFNIFVPVPRSKDNPKPYKKTQAMSNGGGQGPSYNNQNAGAQYQQRTPGQRQGGHIRSGPCVYIGAIAEGLNKEDIETLLSPFNFTEVMFYIRAGGAKRFAFAYFSSPVGAQQAVSTLNGKEVSGKNINVRHVRDKSRARIIEGGSTYQNRMPGGMSNGYHNAESYGHAHQGAGGGLGAGMGLQGNVSLPMSQLQAATDLVYRIDGLMQEVLDDCYFCQRVRGLVSELQYCMQDIQDGASQRHLAARGRGTTMNTAVNGGYKPHVGYQPVFAGRGRAGPPMQYR